MRATLIKSIVFIVATVLATVALAGTIRNSDTAGGRTYTALFTDATSLNRGDDVRMAGVRIGSITDVRVGDGRRALVTFTVSDDVPLRRGSELDLKFRNLVGQRYLSITPGPASGSELKPGHRFSLDETAPALDLTMLFNGFQPLFQFLSPKDVNALSEQIIAVFQGEGATVDGLLASAGRLTQTLATKDQVIGQLISSLSSVLDTVNQRTDQLDTTIVTLQRLVSGLAEDSSTIGSTIDGLGRLTTSVSDLLEDGRAPLKNSITALDQLSGNLAGSSDLLDEFFATAPTKLDQIGRLGSYGSWLNFYVCSIDGRIPLPEGYRGDLGALPVAERCR